MNPSLSISKVLPLILCWNNDEMIWMNVKWRIEKVSVRVNCCLIERKTCILQTTNDRGTYLRWGSRYPDFSTISSRYRLFPVCILFFKKAPVWSPNHRKRTTCHFLGYYKEIWVCFNLPAIKRKNSVRDAHLHTVSRFLLSTAEHLPVPRLWIRWIPMPSDAIRGPFLMLRPEAMRRQLPVSSTPGQETIVTSEEQSWGEAHLKPASKSSQWCRAKY